MKNINKKMFILSLILKNSILNSLANVQRFKKEKTQKNIYFNKY